MVILRLHWGEHSTEWDDEYGDGKEYRLTYSRSFLILLGKKWRLGKTGWYYDGERCRSYHFGPLEFSLCWWRETESREPHASAATT